MRIHALIEDINKKFNFESSTVLKKISEECPVVEELFPNRNYQGRIEYNDDKLNTLIYQVDRFRISINGDYDSLLDNYIWSLINLARKSMSEQKDILVTCYKDKGYKWLW